MSLSTIAVVSWISCRFFRVSVVLHFMFSVHTYNVILFTIKVSCTRKPFSMTFPFHFRVLLSFQHCSQIKLVSCNVCLSFSQAVVCDFVLFPSTGNVPYHPLTVTNFQTKPTCKKEIKGENNEYTHVMKNSHYQSDVSRLDSTRLA